MSAAPSAPVGPGPPGTGGPPRRRPPLVDWRKTTVDGRRVRYGVAGSGRPALFLHGWGLRPNAYARDIEAMAAAGCRVVAPALPGFGGTPELEPEQRTFVGYGAWVGRFCDAVGTRRAGPGGRALDGRWGVGRLRAPARPGRLAAAGQRRRRPDLGALPQRGADHGPTTVLGLGTPLRSGPPAVAA